MNQFKWRAIIKRTTKFQMPKKENVAAEQLKHLHIPVLLQPKSSIFVVWGITMCNVADK